MPRTRAQARDRIEGIAARYGGAPSTYNDMTESDEDDEVSMSFGAVQSLVPKRSASNGNETDYDDDDDDDAGESYVPLRLDSKTLAIKPPTIKARPTSVPPQPSSSSAAAAAVRPSLSAPVVAVSRANGDDDDDEEERPVRQQLREEGQRRDAARRQLRFDAAPPPPQPQFKRPRIDAVSRAKSSVPVRNGEYVVFVRRSIVKGRALSEQPWYQMAVAVAGAAGTDVTELLALPDVRRRPSVASVPYVTPRLPSALGYASVVPDDIRRRAAVAPRDGPIAAVPGDLDDDDDESIVQGDSTSSSDTILGVGAQPLGPQSRRVLFGAGPSAPSTPATAAAEVEAEKQRRRRQQQPSKGGRTRKAQASAKVEKAYDELANKAETLATRDAPPTELELRQLRSRRETLSLVEALEKRRRVSELDEDPLAWLARPWTDEQVPLKPRYAMALEAARDIVRQQFPRTLGSATIEQFERSRSARTPFAFIAGSIINRGFFARGRSPLRASDYERYGEGVTYGMHSLRFARRSYDGRSIELDETSLRSFNEQRAARSPWCQESRAYASSSSVGGGGGGGEYFGAALKRGLLETPGFVALGGRAARESPYGGRGVFL